MDYAHDIGVLFETEPVVWAVPTAVLAAIIVEDCGLWVAAFFTAAMVAIVAALVAVAGNPVPLAMLVLSAATAGAALIARRYWLAPVMVTVDRPSAQIIPFPMGGGRSART